MLSVLKDTLAVSRGSPTVLDEERTAVLQAKVQELYGRAGHAWPLWDGSKAEKTSFHFDEAWRLIGEFNREPCIMFWQPSDEACALKFESPCDLIDTLEEMYGTEFYVTNEDVSYLFCFNDHDVLIAYGDASEWLDNVLTHGLEFIENPSASLLRRLEEMVREAELADSVDAASSPNLPE